MKWFVIVSCLALTGCLLEEDVAPEEVTVVPPVAAPDVEPLGVAPEEAPRRALELQRQSREVWQKDGPISVRTPAPNTPEAVLYAAMQAAMDPDEARGWAIFEALLDPDEAKPTAKASRSWREFNFAAFRRKVPLYLRNDASPAYDIAYVEMKSDGGVKIFVVNEKSSPTPCHLSQRPEGTWRITACGL